MTDLASSLVDAAAEAIGAAVHKPGSRGQAEQAVVAVLETLATEAAPMTLGTYERQSLRRLAAEVRGVGEKGTT